MLNALPDKNIFGVSNTVLNIAFLSQKSRYTSRTEQTIFLCL